MKSFLDWKSNQGDTISIDAILWLVCYCVHHSLAGNKRNIVWCESESERVRWWCVVNRIVWFVLIQAWHFQMTKYVSMSVRLNEIGQFENNAPKSSRKKLTEIGLNRKTMKHFCPFSQRRNENDVAIIWNACSYSVCCCLSLGRHSIYTQSCLISSMFALAHLLVYQFKWMYLCVQLTQFSLTTSFCLPLFLSALSHTVSFCAY